MTQTNPNPNALPLSDPDPDFPPESIRIRIDNNNDHDSVLAWLDALHPVYDRDDSTKGTTNPKSQTHHNNNHNHHPNPNPNSQRFSGNLKATTKSQIIGLPGAAVQHSGHIGHSARRHPPPIFPLKRRVSVLDPGSPEVSCFGKVRSDGGRRRSGGCWSRVLSWFGGKGKGKVVVVAKEERNVQARVEKAVVGAAEGGEKNIPGIGGMRKFVSGRRSASWGGDGEEEEEEEEEVGHVAWSGPLDRRDL